MAALPVAHSWSCRQPTAGQALGQWLCTARSAAAPIIGAPALTLAKQHHGAEEDARLAQVHEGQQVHALQKQVAKQHLLLRLLAFQCSQYTLFSGTVPFFCCMRLGGRKVKAGADREWQSVEGGAMGDGWGVVCVWGGGGSASHHICMCPPKL